MEKYSVRDLPSEGVLSDYSEIERRLLYGRFIKDNEEAKRFLSVSYESGTHDPFLLTDMDKAVSRIIKAMNSKEKIAIFGDFDADGLCASVCWKDFFRRANYENVSFYIPHRHDEGFGLNSQALNELSLDGVSLVITVDCGIADIEVLKEVSNLGFDVIVTDHHEPVNGLPEVTAVVDPKRKDCSYPNPNLTGAGVAFKVIQGILSKQRFNIPEGHEKWLLDLVGISNVSDYVPLVGENRVLTHYGLLVLRKSPRSGLVKLCRKLNLSQTNLTEDDIGFMIAPRLNAASRMGSSEDAFVLLSTYDEAEANRVVSKLEKVNNERKGVVASIVKEVKKNNEVLEGNDVIVTGNPKWRPSLLGLVANSLAQEFSKPVFLWGRDGSQVIKGSCRSSGGVDVLNLMSSVEGVLKQYGGHKFAGGFSVDFDQVHTLRDELNVAYKKNDVVLKEELKEVDGVLSLDDVNISMFRKLEKFSPFGVGNPKPVFKFSNVLIKNIKLFGKQKEHIELVFENSKKVDVRSIGFFMKLESFDRKVEEGSRVDLIATMELSYFKGRPELRLRIVDIC